ncbi:helix-turn-helix domain-containing protein [Pseudooceanicola sp. 216_PA32_1]|uniref:Helix-turn-helix domain-containing protein n=1 Tax=Pseudooceanicola pacificus TaxID=2676438 RepID=A0A844W4Y9_9RHOB|nr:helix-turn-helix transcriptional regulator [Pseudooceanicola pacificus]MWB79326.1 helix-turn-helix domain-containing protein [Pseudooceanicola pacificus]
MTETIQSRIDRVARASGVIFAAGTDYPARSRVPPHSHDRHQLMHAISGVLRVSTVAGHWIVPPEHAVWIPAGSEHSVGTLAPVRMRSLYLRPDAMPGAPAEPRVLGMTPLVRALVVEAVAIAESGETGPRADRLADFLLHELPRLPEQPLALPLPGTRSLLRLCQQFLAAPDARAPLDDWATRAGMSRRSLTRHFRAETGLPVEQWRQQACVFAALPRLVAGERVTAVALDLGYDSPAAFTTMFRRMLGRTPRDYQRTTAT